MTAMARIYVKRIKQGKMTLEQVPPQWYEEVRQALEEEGA
jgi:hypothetical protein